MYDIELNNDIKPKQNHSVTVLILLMNIFYVRKNNK